MKQRHQYGPSRDAGSQSNRGARKTYGISDAAEALGVAPPTLRSWERRYALVTPLRTIGGHRRYGEEDIDRLCLFVEILRRRSAQRAAQLLDEIDRRPPGGDLGTTRDR
jgi:MerR HTH family regulatory protein